MKTYQISEELLRALILYHLADIPEYEDFIKQELSKKMDAITKRAEYAKKLGF